MPRFLITILALTLTITSSPCLADTTVPPALTLAKTYKGKIDITQYWVSEKLDGVRAYWNGRQLISRQGNTYPAPLWFIKNFPTEALDGELWIDRNQFQRLLSIVRKKQAVDTEWQQVHYYVFDLPHLNKPFSQRLNRLQQLVALSAGIQSG